MNALRIRQARPNEAEQLSAIAMRSKAHWGYSDEFMQACVGELTYSPEEIEDDNTIFVVAEQSSEIMGFYALELQSHPRLELEALFVEPAHIGCGVGRALMQHALGFAADRSAATIIIQGDPNAERFYLAAGATQIGSRESGSIAGRELPLFEIAIQSEDGE